MDVAMILETLGTGRQNSKHLDEIAAELATTPSTVKRIIREARRQGAHILSDRQGYWLSESEEELKRYSRMMIKQAVTRFKTIEPINRALKQIGGQISLTELLEASEEDTASEQK